MPKNNGHGQAKILTEQEFSQILKLSKELHGVKYEVLWAIAYYTAARLREVLSLRWRNISKTHITYIAAATKTNETRTCLISPKLNPYLERYKKVNSDTDVSDMLFPGRFKDKPLTFAQAHFILSEVCKYCGIEGVGTHSFRRTAITRLHSSGAGLQTMRDFTGHKSADSLMRYVDIGDNDRARLIDLL